MSALRHTLVLGWLLLITGSRADDLKVALTRYTHNGTNRKCISLDGFYAQHSSPQVEKRGVKWNAMVNWNWTTAQRQAKYWTILYSPKKSGEAKLRTLEVRKTLDDNLKVKHYFGFGAFWEIRPKSNLAYTVFANKTTLSFGYTAHSMYTMKKDKFPSATNQALYFCEWIGKTDEVKDDALSKGNETCPGNPIGGVLTTHGQIKSFKNPEYCATNYGFNMRDKLYWHNCNKTKVLGDPNGYQKPDNAFTFKQNAQGWGYIRSKVHGNLCWSVRDTKKCWKQNVMLKMCQERTDQRWIISGGTIWLKHPHGNHCCVVFTKNDKVKLRRCFDSSLGGR